MNSHGIILLDKRSGQTSFDELRYLKGNFGFTKLGHAGTLDKFADGLLIVLVGYMTKFNQYFLPLEKDYTGTFTFGKETETLDPEGSVISEAAVPAKEAVLSVLQQFTGSISQVPPAYSAVHVDGQRSYKAVRAGKPVVIPERTVTISSLTLDAWDPPYGVFSITCSKGTYVRSLARDIALAAGSRAFVSSLTRNRIGPFKVSEGVRADKFDPSKHLLSPIDALSSAYPVEKAVIEDQHCQKILNGSLPQESWMSDYHQTETESSFIAAVDRNGSCLGWYRREGDRLKSIYVNSGTFQ